MGQTIDRMLQQHTPESEPAANRQAARTTQSREAETLLDVISPVLNFEKTDIEFWLQIAQLVVLIMILRRIS